MKKRFTQMVAVVLIAISILAVCIPVFAETNIPVGSEAYIYNKQKEARVREKADKTSTCVITLKQNTVVTILEKGTGITDKKVWYKIDYKGTVGWVREDYLKKKTNSDSGSGSTTTGWKERYGEKTFVSGSGVPKEERGHYENFIKDLIAWAKDADDPAKAGKVWDNNQCFRKLKDVTKVDMAGEESIRKFQSCVGLTSDGLAGEKTKKALWNETH